MLSNNIYNKAYLNTIVKESTERVYLSKVQIANEIGGTYDRSTNTIDCDGHYFRFLNRWLNSEGSFDFKLTNLHHDCNRMFMYCDKLKHLPESFTIPEYVTNCQGMFYQCEFLIDLPKNFTIPQGVEHCGEMFCYCESLTHLPDNFTISNTVVNCNGMFMGCESLTQLPDNFTIPNSVDYCESMFLGCKSLINIPSDFRIPAKSDYEDIFDGCINLKDTDPESYMELTI